MDWGPLRRQAIALIAAYAVALQALLSAAVPVAAAVPADLIGVLCSYDNGGTNDPARNNQRCAAACAALSQGVAGPLPPDVVVAVIEPSVTTAGAPRSDWVPPQPAIRAPWLPRGPPLA